jgi:osmotically-inducible protein OsmY
MSTFIRPLVAAAMLAVSATMPTGCLALQEKTIGESLDETSTGTQIKTKMFADSVFKKFGEVKVEVAGRFVLLAGRVPSEKDKQEAEQIAWSARAVDEVANELIVGNRDFGRDVNDSWIKEQIRLRLIADSKIKGVNYNTVVFNGAVYLLGIAQSEDELRKAAESASTVKGVQKVVSYVKMRDRRPPPLLARPESTSTAALGQPAGVQASTDEPIRLAPIEDPAQPPSKRGVYPDPYGQDIAPLSSKNQLESGKKN